MLTSRRVRLRALLNTLVVVALVGAGLSAGHRYLLQQRTTTYSAHLSDAAGLHAGDEVKVAGIIAGEVREVVVDGAQVRVAFSLPDDVELGRTSVVEVKLANLFGKRYLEVRPGGPGELPDGAVLTTTSSPPFTLQDLVTTAGTQLPELDTRAIQDSIAVLADAFAGTSAAGKAALTGIADLSTAVARRSEALDRLVTRSAEVTGVLSDQREQLVDLMANAAEVLRIVHARRADIHRLLAEIDALGERVTGLVRTNEADLKNILEDTAAVSEVLRANDTQLREIARLFAPTSRYLANATGTGPWMQVFAPYLLLPDSVNCLSERKCE